MKKIGLLLLFFAVIQTTFAKKVKFAVNMKGQVINVTGIHVSGDFQLAAGFPGTDWDSGSTTLTRETADTNIYSIIVNIPAFAKYEYKFVNGDQFYEVEFVPEKSRVGYDFNDNRWIYIDSTANDTTFIGAIMFGGNAPEGLNMMRYIVDMTGLTPSVNGIHVTGTYNAWQLNRARLYSFASFAPNIYETIEFAPQGNYEYKFLNGNTMASAEIMPATCSVNGNRILGLMSDTILLTATFASCLVATEDESLAKNNASISPNPAGNTSILSTYDGMSLKIVQIFDVLGKNLRIYSNIQSNTLQIDRNELPNGIYFLKMANGLVKKWVLE
ncbi:MAG: hypothetical protein RI894_1399 [Bacteroidota bacterium]|jgi:hypothetical protein